MRSLIPLLLSALIALPASAQDTEGNDTAGNWRGTHQRLIGIEPGRLFAPGSIRIEGAGKRLWHSNWPGCMTGLGCACSDGSA